jgi:3-ketosteroid 9alpha-monooxygenase subunit A
MAVRPRYPLPRYPTGWFQVAWSTELEPGVALPLKYFGKDLVAFRDEDGVVKVLDAFCPHLGAHLGHGGKVEGGRITCPFHAWEFDGAGQCTKIPYADKVPRKASLEAWHAVERNGLIMVWHDSDGRDPFWEVPELTEFGDSEWAEPETRQWRIRTHNQEMAENMVDTAHFRYLHGTVNYPDAKVEAREHILHMAAPTTMTTPAGEVEGQIEAVAFGFGFSSNRFSGLVETLLLGCVAPVDDEYVDVRFTFTLKRIGGRSITKGVGAAFVREISRQLEQDKPVWENKIYIDPPVLCDGDGPIGLFRRWCKQFYPEAAVQEAYEAYHGRPMPHARD